ncbi:MAG: polysaccharide deacetylase family protein [Bdellovibrio sp.]|nr:polysaccharide deacetylase family protein [Bdellovibrio sp.]
MNTIALSFDIEDWFCVQNMKEIFPFKKWNLCELRVYESTNYILKTLNERNIKATFFVLGWVAERIPDLVLNIAKQGHEIATHGYSHTPINHMTRNEFQKDTEKSLSLLQDIVGRPIYGYRAPSFSITKNTLWALDILRELGIKYDSSINPIKHPEYGIVGFNQEIHFVNGILEVPLAASSLWGVEIPISGGGFFRLYPYWFFKMMLRKKSSNGHAVTYFHPWEFDSKQPKIKLPLSKKFRHYIGLEKNKNKFEKFLNDFEFVPICQLINGHLPLMISHEKGPKLDQEVIYLP